MTSRETEEERFYIYQNWSGEEAALPLPEGEIEAVYGEYGDKLAPCGLVVIKIKK